MTRMEYRHLKQSRLSWRLPVAVLAILCLTVSNSAGAKDRSNYCTKTAKLVREACFAEAKDDLMRTRANCINVSDRTERGECFKEARESRSEAIEECRDVFDARKDVCDAVGEDRYDPSFEAADFVDPDAIGDTIDPNPYFPLVVGHEWVYEGNGETITVTVTNKVKMVDGVPCRVVSDTVMVGGFPIEITDDWYAQHENGDLWYCGESVRNYEVFSDDLPVEAELVDIEGSWKAGRERAKAGISHFFSPQVGTTYRQEVFLGDAEDVVEVLSITESESTPGGSCSGNCLMTRDFTPLDPGVNEYKYYVPGIGQILEIDAEGNRIELVSFSE
ncbi:MAG: hypothetical protein KDD64_13345 [Bdellovibrionales bacterium]|nr:hypothetical protein [Bdellovibrionales bacterium]